MEIGEDHPNAKCTNEMLELWRTGRFKQKKLAEMFGMTRTNICLIVNGKAWKHCNSNQKINAAPN